MTRKEHKSETFKLLLNNFFILQKNIIFVAMNFIYK